MEAALSALQVDMCCIKLSCNSLGDIHSAIEKLTKEVQQSSLRGQAGASSASAAAVGRQQEQQQRLLDALNAEVLRLRAAREARDKADQALDALQRRLQEGSVDDELLEAEVAATEESLPEWLQHVAESRAEEEVMVPDVSVEMPAISHRGGNTARDGPLSRRYTQHTDSFSSATQSVVRQDVSGTGLELRHDNVTLLESATEDTAASSLRRTSADVRTPRSVTSGDQHPAAGSTGRAAAEQLSNDAGFGGDTSISMPDQDPETSDGLVLAASTLCDEPRPKQQQASAAANLHQQSDSGMLPPRSHRSWAPETGSCVVEVTTSSSSSKAREALRSQKDAVKDWYKSELRRMHAAFKVSASKDVHELVKAMEGLREHNERLDMQKRLLLSQVLQLETQLEETRHTLGKQVKGLEGELQRAKIEVAVTKRMARDMVAAAEMKNKDEQGGSGQGDAAAACMPFIDDASWDEQERPEVLLPQIFSLWNQLHVPLVYRSQFFLMFCNDQMEENMFYFDMEKRKLDWRASMMNHNSNRKQLEAAKQALELEGRMLAQNLRRALPDEERERVLQAWGISLATKGRKMQLVRMLWDEKTLRHPEGAKRSAAMVQRLTRPDDQQFMKDVFGNHGARDRPSPLGLAVTSLIKRVATPRVHARPPPAPAPLQTAPSDSSAMATPRRSSFMSWRLPFTPRPGALAEASRA